MGRETRNNTSEIKMTRHMTHTPRCQLRRTATATRYIDGWIETGYSGDEQPDGTPGISFYKHAVRIYVDDIVEEQWFWIVEEEGEKPSLNQEGDDE